MISDFSAARLHLEQASHHLSGDDEVSGRAREALDLLIAAMTCEQLKRPTVSAKVLYFPKLQRKS
ncbi:hypothetical protein [Pseudaminobacter sp. NGMCC 1.201702]|uniref:hypothetical protein n=1 Tax=Pseudaminobacter sp. NGMCC 1.201702 TaxID=3391825 RepID=UPI0039F131F6